MTTALQARPVVSCPRPRAGESDPFVFHGRRLRAGRAPGNTSRFSDDAWNLGQAMLKKHGRRFVPGFTLIPSSTGRPAGELCYAMFPGPSLRARNGLRRAPSAPPSPAASGSCAGQLGRAPRPEVLTGADPEDFQRFAARSLPAAGARRGARAGVRKFWLTAKRAAAGRAAIRPRAHRRQREPAHGARENAAVRIPEEAPGPLFAWAMRFIGEFSAGILAADRRWRAPPPPSAEPRHLRPPARFAAPWPDARIAAGQLLPGWRGRTGATAIAGAPGRNRICLARRRHLTDEAAALAGTGPRTVSGEPVRARPGGQPWIAVILAGRTGRGSPAALARLLQDACYLVLAFLPGARGSEIKQLAPGGLRSRVRRGRDALPPGNAQPGLEGRKRPRRRHCHLEHRGTRRPGHRCPRSSCSHPAPGTSSPASSTAPVPGPARSARCWPAGFRAEAESEQALARGGHRMAAVGACEHTRLTGPAAGAARRPGTFGERGRFQGSVVLDAAPATAAHGQARPGRLSRRVHHLRPRPHQGAG